MRPVVDINLFVHDGANTVAASIDSVLAQSWTDWRLTLIDDGSADGTTAILQDYARRHPCIRLKRNRCNTGAVGAFQRGLWLGDADYIMPKSADDLIAPNFVESLMNALLDHPGAAMVHAGALSFQGAGQVRFEYPPSHRLHATGAEPVARARQVMAHYTSAPSFWGVYRRAAVDRLLPILPRAGWDHVLLAELALYGEIRHVPDILYWRRGGGRPVADLARAATAEAARGLPIDAPISDPLWHLPCITTAYAHVEAFTLARVPAAARQALIGAACAIFRRRWEPSMLQEARAGRVYLTGQAAAAPGWDAATRALAHLQSVRLLTALALLLPELDLTHERRLAAGIAGAERCLA